VRKKGLIFVVSAPSATGKTTVIKRFLEKHNRDFVISVSATTRSPRKGEKDGKDYFFISREKFREYIKKGKFLECARVLDNYYGTLKETVVEPVNRGKNVIMDVDVRGARSIKRKIKGSVTIFLVPPSFRELKNRLKKRKTETKKDMKQRLELAKKELKEKDKYDYIVINREIGEAVNYMECVFKLEQFKKYEIK